jgi:hypothetical protein
MSKLAPLLIFFFTFSLFLLLQTVIHARRWREATNEPIPLSFKNMWSLLRGGVYSANAAYYVATNDYILAPNIAYEILRITLLQMSIFWLIYDILLPLFADRPQLWQDPDLGDNNSFFDRIGGDWIGNLIIKLVNLLFCIGWLLFTDPGEFLPIIPNHITWIGVGVGSIGMLIVYLYKIKIMSYPKISLFDLFTRKYGRRNGMVLIFVFSMVVFPTVCLLLAGVVSSALNSQNEFILNIGGGVSFILVILSIKISQVIKIRRPESLR